MRDIIAQLPPAQVPGREQEPREVPNIFLKPGYVGISQEQADFRLPGIQTRKLGITAPSPIQSFDGQDYTSCGPGCVPPDTNGDVSDKHFIQWVNTSWAIYDKITGSKVSGPTPGNSFWIGFGGACESGNDGDPIALWDPQAHRWVMSQFSVAGNAQCVAISTTSDPLGTYYRYQFNWPNFGDYPKLAVWTDTTGTQDAYLLITHEFDASSNFVGAAFIAMQRDKMLQGQPAAMVRFPGNDAYGVEPVNLTGLLAAPAGSCPAYVHFDASTSEYKFWDLCLNWTTPASSTLSATPTRVAAGAPFVPNYNDVAELGTSSGLNAFGTHIMYRANARAFPPGAPTQLSLAVNHTVLGAAQQGGIKWVHFALKSSSPSVPSDRIFSDGFDPAAAAQALGKAILDEGTFAPDNNTRWMGGIAVDANGDIGVGYSVSSSSINPKINITGRSLNDAAGMLRDEQTCTAAATGSQLTTLNRWGDYSSMSVDPADQCTFWFTNEYYPTTSSGAWSTRICSFRFAGCGSPDFAFVSDTPRRLQICGATATADPSYALRAGVLNGFAGPVTLDTSGIPAGTTASFSVNPIQAPGSSTFTLTGGRNLPSGEYSYTAIGASGALTRTLGLQLGVSATAAAAPPLVAPVNATTGVKVRPLLSWTATPGALSYTVEVATSAAFSTIVASGNVTGTSWAVNVSLTPNTQYFWRVRAHNYCGDGANSAAFSFTTGVPGQCAVGTTLNTVFKDNFQGGINGWTTAGGGATGWTQMTAPTGTGLTGTLWGIPDNSTTSDRQLISPTIALPAAAKSVMLSYDTYHHFEENGPQGCWDNATLTIKAGNAAGFSYLGPNRMFTDPYTGLVASGEINAGLTAWCQVAASVPVRSVVDLDDFAGQSVQLNFRATTDSNGVAPAPNGWYIANLKVDVCQ
ncbi:hypothetical protein GCM10009105_30940 [Dokdonella soli]|uniref:Fibronectin type-III domain-containing protein n=2 Tax=Dokdonella soli TaxID=529810 RepID=A0ABP3U3Q2_9GAMM